jgi:hypothetical protein
LDVSLKISFLAFQGVCLVLFVGGYPAISGDPMHKTPHR